MNLTSKRMLQFLTVCAGACALTASAQTRWIDDNFEAEGTGFTNAAINQLAGTYKMAVWGVQSENTNLLWFASSEDASKIVSNLVSYTGRTPLQGSTTAQCLELNTEGQTLTRAVVVNGVTGSVSIADGPKYLDTLIKFTPSEDAPTIEEGVKVAIWVDVNSNLVVRHIGYTPEAAPYTTNSVFASININPAQWYRLTVGLSTSVFGGSAPAFEIWLDNTKLTHANGAVNAETFTGGSWFFTLVNTVGLSQISFQGTGSVDELVLASEVDLTPLTGLLLTLVFNDSMMDVYADGDLLTSSPTNIANNAALIITNVVDWYQLNGVAGAGITYSGTTGALVKASSGTITADEAGRTGTVVLATYTGAWPAGMEGSFTNYSFSQVAAWAAAHGVTEADAIANSVAYQDNYLLNVDETTTATLKITSIVYNAGTQIATITVEATDDSETDAVDFTTINGELVVWTSDDLVTWGEPTSNPFVIQSTTSTSVEIDVPALAGKFIKARVE